jgi:ribulose-5-phosphate 4-epimerase/fuculose-1-phosphate aldolase
MNETQLREAMVDYAHSLFARGYGCGTSGNLSARLDDDHLLLTPTNISLGRLTVDGLTRVRLDGSPVDGPVPTKEAWLHLAAYRARPGIGAVVHLHSTHAVAMSCLEVVDTSDVLPPITPYAVMRFGRVALAPYFRPGDTTQADLIEGLLRDHRAILLSNHGPVVTGADLPAAIAAAEELEETSKLYFVLDGHRYRRLTAEQVAELNAVFGG